MTPNQMARAALERDCTELDLRVLFAIGGLNGKPCSPDELLDLVKGKRERLEAALKRVVEKGWVTWSRDKNWFVRFQDAPLQHGPAQGEAIPMASNFMAHHDCADMQLSAGSHETRTNWDKVKAAVEGHHDASAAAQLSIPTSRGGENPAAGIPPTGGNLPVAGNTRAPIPANRGVPAFPPTGGNPMSCNHALNLRHDLTCHADWDPEKRVNVREFDQMRAGELFSQVLRAIGRFECGECKRGWQARIIHEDPRLVEVVTRQCLESRIKILRPIAWCNREYIRTIKGAKK